MKVKEKEIENNTKPTIELVINSQIQDCTPPLSSLEYERLKESIKTYGLREPIHLMADGQTIIDGHHRYKACMELGIEPKVYIHEDIKTLEQAKELARELNDARRQMNLPKRILTAYQTYYKELRAQARKRQLAHLKHVGDFYHCDNNGEPSSVSKDTNERGRTRERLAKELGISQATLVRAITIIERAPQEYLQLWLEERIATLTMATAVEALETIPEEYKKNKEALIEWTLEDPEQRIPQVKHILGNTNAVFSMLEQEDEETQKKVKEKFKSQFYTAELNLQEVLWWVEEISQSSHKLSRGIKLAEEIGETWEEAHAWFAHYGGRCIREVKAWEGEWDKYQEELERKGKFMVGDKRDGDGS